jgi:hypothetical protein
MDGQFKIKYLDHGYQKTQVICTCICFQMNIPSTGWSKAIGPEDGSYLPENK